VNSTNRNLILWVIIGLFLLALYNMFQSGSEKVSGQQVSYSDFLKAVDGNRVTHVVLKEKQAIGTFSGGQKFQVFLLHDPSLIERLDKHGVEFTGSPTEEGGFSFFSILLSWFPMLLLIGVWVFFLRQMQSGNNRAMGFGKSRAKLLTEKQGKITFDDVAGVDEAKQEVEEIVDYLKDPRKFQKLGGKIPKGVLLVGNPGTGKTLLARAIAGEAGVPFFSISGSDFVEMFVGVGASRVRDLFEQGKKNAPCIIFIDEIDAVGRHRGAGLGGGNDEREQTLNQLLVEMDGFDTNEGVILIAATNRPDVLDPALLRPGRFDRQVVVPLPDIVGRDAILAVHMTQVPIAADVERKTLARGTPGFSGADLKNLVNEAALIAARQNKRVVTMSDFEYAKDKIMMGPERRSMVMTDDEKRLTAYHEGGHALVGHLTPGSDPIHKATIIPRGRALGMVMRLPERDKLSVTRQQLHADLAVAMGGRAAEELIFGYDNVTTGASSDITHATSLARRMVTRFGMSDKLGPLAYAENEDEVFLGHSVSRQQHMSDRTVDQIDQEVRRIIDEAYDYAKKLLKKNSTSLKLIAENLLEYETLSGEEIDVLLKGGKIVRTETKSQEPLIKPRSSTPMGTAKKKTKAPKDKKETVASDESKA
jgi:cell division protease FtsH